MNLDPPWIRLQNWFAKTANLALVLGLFNLALLVYLIDSLNQIGVKSADSRGYDYVALGLTIVELIITVVSVVFVIMAFLGFTTLRRIGESTAERVLDERIDGLLDRELSSRLPPLLRDALETQSILSESGFDATAVATAQENGK